MKSQNKIIIQKQQLRKQYFTSYKENKHLDEANERELSLMLYRFLTFRFPMRRNLKVLLYSPYASELNILKIVSIMPAKYIIAPYLPMVVGKKMRPYSYLNKRFSEFYKMNLIITPGLFFTLCGNRLGRGGGYYDRILSYYPKEKTIALIRTWQLLDYLPCENHDRRVATLITNDRIIKTNNGY